MNKDLEVWKFVQAKLENQISVMLLIVAESFGSSPGRQGFKMAIAGEEMCGSIGGGVMEVALVSQSRSKVKSRKSKIIEQVHRKNVANASGMICSGKQTVVFRQLTSEDVETVEKLVSETKTDNGRFLEVTSEKFQIVSSETFDFANKFSQSATDFRYLEKIGFRHKLYIVGGGHCSLALSEIMSKLDFHITVFDDRPHLNTLAKNDFADEVKILSSYEKIGDLIVSAPNAYVVVMTIGYKFDDIVVRRLLDKNFRYFGVLGSKAKMHTLLSALENEGFDRNRLNRISTPIGLPINSHSPEEIAISIAAEIISVKNAKNSITDRK